MKVVNLSRILLLIRNYALSMIVFLSIFSFFHIYSHEKVDIFARVISPKYLGLDIVTLISWTTGLLSLGFFTICVVHILKVLQSEYYTVWPQFIEGPDENGEREVLSFSQVEYAGRDLLGRFIVASEGKRLVLPGKLSISREREILRKIKSISMKTHF